MKKLLIALTFFSCGTQQKLDKKAVSRVKANIDLLDEVGQAWYKINPQEKDTVDRYVKGEVQYLPIPILDTSKIDSIKNGLTQELREKCSQSIEVAYVAGWNEALLEKLDQPVRVDTFFQQLPPDNRYQKLQADSIGKLGKELAFCKGQINSFEERNKSLQATIYYLITALVLLGIIIGLLIKFKLFKNG